jgi:diguanylate cyclase (GGDEF)-like protein
MALDLSRSSTNTLPTRWINIISVLIFSLLITHHAQALEKISVQLDWKYQFEFAGFIMAKEKGFYKEAGVDVELIEYESGMDAVDNVLKQKANYGLHNSSVIMQDGKLQPVILLATYFQQSPLIFVTSKHIKNTKDLIGKTVMGTKTEFKYSSLALLLNHFYINRSNTKFIDHTFNIDDFIEGKVDAMTAFRTNQLFKLDELGIEYNIIDPADFGFITSAVNLFTSRTEALQHPKRTQKFIDASNKGWRYALDNPREAMNIIYNKYSQEKSIPALEYEYDVTKTMMLLDFFSIGTINKDLSLRTVRQLKHNGVLEKDQVLGTFLFDELINESNQSGSFNKKQQMYLHNKKVITMCTDPDWMPFESIQNGKHIGIAADLIASMAKKLPIPIKLIETSTWNESLEKAKNGECDILSLASVTPERSAYLDFTRSHLSFPIVMATANDKFFINDLSEIRDKKLGIVKGYAIAEVLKDRIDGINIVDVNSTSEGLKLLEQGQLYGYIDNIVTIAAVIQKDFAGMLKISSRLPDDVHLSIATRKDEPMLLGIFDKLVHDIGPEKSQEIYNKWVSVKQEVLFDYSLMWKVLSAVLLLSLGFIYHNYQLRLLNQRLKTLSITDKLTGLHNRVKIDEVLLEQKATVDRYKTDAAIILLDIDFFKPVNDNFGHPAGDIVLKNFATILTNNVRTTDYTGRWGGEEFIIICPNISMTEANTLAEKLLKIIRETSFPSIGKLTASAGIAAFSESHSIKDTMARVDQALYHAKQTGRDKVSCITQSSRQ